MTPTAPRHSTMTSEMVERVAQAIHRSDGIPINMARVYASSAIKAMREPTDAMLDAPDEAFHAEWKRQRESLAKRLPGEAYASGPFSSRIWTAMIDSALEPTPATGREGT